VVVEALQGDSRKIMLSWFRPDWLGQLVMLSRAVSPVMYGGARERWGDRYQVTVIRLTGARRRLGLAS